MARPANRSVLLGGAILAVVVSVGVLAPVLATSDPSVIDPAARNRKPGAERTVRGDRHRPRDPQRRDVGRVDRAADIARVLEVGPGQ